MKKALLIIPAALALAGCVNSSTNFSNRGVTYQVTPELNGNAEKTFESAAKTNVAQTLTDTSENDQSKAEAQPKAAKAEAKAEAKAQPKEAEAK